MIVTVLTPKHFNRGGGGGGGGSTLNNLYSVITEADNKGISEVAFWLTMEVSMTSKNIAEEMRKKKPPISDAGTLYPRKRWQAPTATRMLV